MANIPEGFSRVGVIGTYWHNNEWNENETYYQWNAVPYEGSSYLALVDNPSGPPINDGENWLIIAKRGDDGAGGVTGIRGKAEDESVDHKGLVIITKEMLGLENVENKSAEVILSELTKEQVETLLETPNLKETLDAKLDKADLNDLALTSITKETLETILEHADIAETLDGKLDLKGAKETLELDHVDNLSYEEIKEKLLSEDAGIIPEDIHAVEKTNPLAENTVYAAHQDDAKTYSLKLAEDLEEVGYVFNTTDKQAPIPENYNPLDDRIALLTPLLHMLKGGFYNWVINEMLADVHPVTGVRGEAEDKYNAGEVTITKESLGLSAVPDKHPDSFGVGFLFSGKCESAGEDEIKTVKVQDDFVLQDGRAIFITFMENNTSPSVSLDINESGPVPVYIKTFPVKEYNCTTFQRYGNYLFQYDGTAWNYVTGSNDIIDVRVITIELDSWTYVEEDDVWMTEIELENLSGNEDLTVNVPSNLPDEEYLYNYEQYMRANLIDGESTGHSLILYAEKKPRDTFKVSITVSV